MKPFTPSGVLLISYSISKSSFTSSINSPHCHSYCSPVWRFVHPMPRPSERDSDGISFLSSRQSYQYRVQYNCLYFIRRSAGILSSILESPWATFATDSHWPGYIVWTQRCFGGNFFTITTIIFKEHFVYIRPLTLGQMCLIEKRYMHVKYSFPLQHSGWVFYRVLTLNIR